MHGHTRTLRLRAGQSRDASQKIWKSQVSAQFQELCLTQTPMFYTETVRNQSTKFLFVRFAAVNTVRL